MLVQFIPSMILQIIYAIIVYHVAVRRRVNPWLWVIGTLVPVIGLIVGSVFFLLSFLSVLERLNRLEEKA